MNIDSIKGMSQLIAVASVHGSGYKEPDFADDIIAKLHDYPPNTYR